MPFPRRHTNSTELRDAAIRLRQSGLSHLRIAETLGISLDRVKGLARRPKPTVIPLPTQHLLSGRTAWRCPDCERIARGAACPQGHAAPWTILLRPAL